MLPIACTLGNMHYLAKESYDVPTLYRDVHCTRFLYEKTYHNHNVS